MATKTVTKTANENVNEWGDVEETLLTPLMKYGVTSAFGLLVITRITMAAVLTSYWFDMLREFDVPGKEQLATVMVFSIFDLVAVLAFTGFLAIPALFNPRIQNWARVTFLAVAMIVLTASNALAIFGLTSLA